MTAYDVEVEFVNGQTTWVTVEAVDALVAEVAVKGEYGPNVWDATAHPHGSRPGLLRQPRRVDPA